MQNRKKSEGKKEELESRIARLEMCIMELKSEIDSKDIIINALVGQTKAERKKASTASEKGDENVKKFRNNFGVGNITKEMDSAFATSTKNDAEANTPENIPESDRKVKNLKISDCTMELTSQIKDIFSPKSKNTDFKPNYTFKKFVDYAENSYEFTLKNKKVSKSKNPMKMFIEANLDRVVKFLIDNVNTLNLNQICSTFFLINSEIEYGYKLVIVHDIVLELDNYSKLGFICSAIFNNLELKEDVFSDMIRKILFHQFCIDSKLFLDPEIVEYLNEIRDNLGLFPGDKTLWETLPLFFSTGSIFSTDKSQVHPETVEKGFALRMLCHYLDWNYTYNSFIVTVLHPRLWTERSPMAVYYLGILAVNAARMFRSDESITLIFEELREILEWKNECSVVAYMILKQFFEVDCDNWINENKGVIESLGFKIEYLKKALLI